MEALRALEEWPVSTAAAGVVVGGEVVAVRGPSHTVLPWASVTKVVTALAVLVAVEEETIALDDPAGPPGSTVRHLLAHASGLGSDDAAEVRAEVGTRRIYSNAGFEVLATVVAERAGMGFADYAAEAVVRPLGMASTTVHGSPAHGTAGSLDDLLRLAAALMRPTLVSAETLATAAAVAFPGLPGILPGFGEQETNDWGLGVEIRDGKSPHWTGAANSPRTFGHFGRSGTFVWVDPEAGCALACLTDRQFGPWAATAWPALADAVLSER